MPVIRDTVGEQDGVRQAEEPDEDGRRRDERREQQPAPHWAIDRRTRRMSRTVRTVPATVPVTFDHPVLGR